MPQSKEYRELLNRRGKSSKKEEAASRGRIVMQEPKRDAARVEFERLLSKAQRTSDDVNPKLVIRKFR